MQIFTLFASALRKGDHDDHETLHCRVEVDADDIGEVEDIADDRQENRSNYCAGDAAGATLQRGAADDDRGNRFQFPQQTGAG